jgi:(p)ppGpp synthase/HD superfamily hydrolase
MEYVKLLEDKIKSELADCIGYLVGTHDGVKEQSQVEQRLSSVRNIIDAIQFAKKIHKDQVDLGKQPYINHPLRVAGRILVENGGVNCNIQDVELAIITALLHDTVEDAEKHVDVITVIKSIGGWTCLRAVKCLTKEEGETYETYIERVSRNDLATLVKIADLQDNLDPSRVLKETPGSLKRREKYEKALNFLKSKIKK